MKDDDGEGRSATRSGMIEIALNATLPMAVFSASIVKDVEIGNKEAIAVSAITEMRFA